MMVKKQHMLIFWLGCLLILFSDARGQSQNAPSVYRAGIPELHSEAVNISGEFFELVDQVGNHLQVQYALKPKTDAYERLLWAFVGMRVLKTDHAPTALKVEQNMLSALAGGVNRIGWDTLDRVQILRMHTGDKDYYEKAFRRVYPDRIWSFFPPASNSTFVAVYPPVQVNDKTQWPWDEAFGWRSVDYEMKDKSTGYETLAWLHGLGALLPLRARLIKGQSSDSVLPYLYTLNRVETHGNTVVRDAIQKEIQHIEKDFLVGIMHNDLRHQIFASFQDIGQDSLLLKPQAQMRAFESGSGNVQFDDLLAYYAHAVVCSVAVGMGDLQDVQLTRPGNIVRDLVVELGESRSDGREIFVPVTMTFQGRQILLPRLQYRRVVAGQADIWHDMHDGVMRLPLLAEGGQVQVRFLPFLDQVLPIRPLTLRVGLYIEETVNSEAVNDAMFATALRVVLTKAGFRVQRVTSDVDIRPDKFDVVIRGKATSRQAYPGTPRMYFASAELNVGRVGHADTTPFVVSDLRSREELNPTEARRAALGMVIDQVQADLISHLKAF